MYTNTANRFEGVLSDIMASTDLEAKVVTTDGGPSSPAYLIIEPDVPEQVEIILFDGTFDSTTFRTSSLSNRYLSGSAAAEGIDHPSGSKVISGPLSQIIEDLHDRVDAAVPTGAIMMWSGSVASIPGGFALCDGANGTPDLRNRFIVGAGSTYNPDDTGGASNVALNTAQLPGHTHGSGNLAGGGHTHGSGNLNSGNSGISHSHGSGNYNTGNTTVSGGGHVHDINVRRPDSNSTQNHGHSATSDYLSSGVTQVSSSVEVTSGPVYSSNHSHGNHSHNFGGTSSASNPSHSHNVGGNTNSSGSTVSGSTSSTGSGSSHENKPPYYALAFIMKV